MFRTRLISGIILVLIAIATIVTGKEALSVTLCFVSVIAYRELISACGVCKKEKGGEAVKIVGICMILLYYAALSVWGRLGERGNVFARADTVVTLITALTLIAFMFLYVFTFPRYKANQIMASMFSFLYAPVMLSFIYLIREGNVQGKFLVWYIFLCSWGSDTCAYAVGVLIGKHKMSPKLSPKKSVEGAVGGVLGAALLFVLYNRFVIGTCGGSPMPHGLAAALGAVGALVSMVGDLAASAIKRDYEIKDYGKLIPGHGGIMDRFDSVIIAAPVIYAGLTFMEYIGY